MDETKLQGILAAHRAVLVALAARLPDLTDIEALIEAADSAVRESEPAPHAAARRSELKKIVAGMLLVKAAREEDRIGNRKESSGDDLNPAA